MEKLVYVSYDQSAHVLREHLDQLDLPRAVESAALYLLDPPASGEGPSAVLTAWLSCVDRRAPIERFLERGGRFHGYVASETSLSRRALPEVTRATVELMEMPENVPNVNVWLDTLELSRDGMREGVQFARNLLVRALSSEAPHLVLVREGVGAQAREAERSTSDRSSWLPERRATIPPPVASFGARSTTIPPPPGDLGSWLPPAPRGDLVAEPRSSVPPALSARSSVPPPRLSTLPASAAPGRVSTLPSLGGERLSQLPASRLSSVPPGMERPSQLPQRPSQLGLYAHANTSTGERLTLRRGQL
jgi:hypothetical protein